MKKSFMRAKKNGKCHRYKAKSQVQDTNLLNHTPEVPREVKRPGKEESTTFVLFALLELSNLTPLLPLVGQQTSSVLWGMSQVIQPLVPSPKHSSSYLYFKRYPAPSCLSCCSAPW